MTAGREEQETAVSLRRKISKRKKERKKKKDTSDKKTRFCSYVSGKVWDGMGWDAEAAGRDTFFFFLLTTNNVMCITLKKKTKTQPRGRSELA